MIREKFCKISLIFLSISIYLIWRLVGCRMPCEVSFPFESSIALVTLERLFPSVCPHVSLQSRWLSASIVALVTLVRFFSLVCFLVWSFNSNVVTLEKLHIVQLCCFSPECVLLCLLKVLDCLVLYSHLLQWKVFFSKCVLLCFFKLLDWVFPWCASWYAFWGQKNVCMRSCTVCACAVSPTCEWVRVSSTH